MAPLNRTLAITLLVLQVGHAGVLAQAKTSSAPERSPKQARVVTLDAEQAATIAVKVSPGVHLAAASKQQADDAAETSAALFAPELDLTGSYTRLSPVTYPPFEFGGERMDNPFPVILNNYLLRATVTLPVTDYFLKIMPTYQAVDFNADVSEYQRQAEIERIALRAREAFYNYVKAEASIKVAQDSVKHLEDYVKDLDALFEAGNVTRADAMQAQAQLANAKAQLAVAVGTLQVSKDTLRRLLYVSPDTEFNIAENIFVVSSAPAPASQKALLAEALRDRPEIKALRALGKVRDATIDSEQARRLPNLSLVGNLDYANPNARYIPLTEEFKATWDVSAVLRWSPNDFVLGKIDVEKAELELKRARTDLRLLQDQIVVETSQASSEYHAAQSAVQSAKVSVEAAEEAWRVRRDLFRAGEATSNEVLESEIALRRAQRLQIDANVGLRLARARLQHLVGKAAPSSKVPRS